MNEWMSAVDGQPLNEQNSVRWRKHNANCLTSMLMHPASAADVRARQTSRGCLRNRPISIT